jgi:GGDEF domain-containing protein
VAESLQPDVVLAGGERDALDVLRQIRSSPRWRRRAVVTAVGPQRAADALRAGANAVVDPDPDDDALVERLVELVDFARAAEEHEQRDPVSGLLRPRAFLQWVADRLDGGTPLALALVKLWVHSASAILLERVLAAVAARLREEDGGGALWCRWGAGELAVAGRAEAREALLTGLARATHAVEAELLSDRPSVRATIETAAAVAASPADGSCVEALLLAADRRLPG